MITTHVRYRSSPLAMPLSMAARTSSQPPAWAAAWPVATSTSPTTVRRRPSRYGDSRESPSRRLLGGTRLVSEQRRELAAEGGQLRGRALLGDHAAGQHDRPVSEDRKSVV